MNTDDRTLPQPAEYVPEYEDRDVYRLGYSRGYSKGYSARGQRYAAINSAEVARQVRAVIGERSQINFDAPQGRRLTLLLPKEITGDELAYFREVVTPYLDLLEKRLQDKDAITRAAAEIGKARAAQIGMGVEHG